MTFEHQLIKNIIGEEMYHQLVCELGGLQISFKKGSRETIFYFYNKGLSIKKIAYKLGITERFVRKVINEKINSYNNKNSFFN